MRRFEAVGFPSQSTVYCSIGVQKADCKMNITRYDVRAGDRPAGASFASRSAVYGCSGAAGTAHPYSTLTAIDILKGGGSAADAAVAAAACLGFLEPTGSGLGGDCYALIWDPSVSKVTGLAGSGRSPKSLSLDTVRSRSPHGLIAPYGAIAVSTPGALDAWWTMHQRFGRLKWGEVFEPAIAMCERGVPVPQVIAHHWQRDLEVFREPGSRVEEWANAMRTYAPAGHAPREGDLFRNPDLACTYRTIAEGGRDAFYEGDIARAIDAYFRRIGGWLSLEDLKAHSERMGRPAGQLLPRCRCLCDGCQYAGAGDPSDAQHPGEFRSALDGLPIRRVDSHASGGEATGLRGPRPPLCGSGFLGRPDRMAEFQGLRSRAGQADPAGSGSRERASTTTPRIAAIPPT